MCVCCVFQVCLPRQGELLDRLSEMACDSPHLYSSDSAAKCYSAIVNKQKAGKDHTGLASKQTQLRVLCYQVFLRSIKEI